MIHLAAIVGGIANFHKLPHTLTEVNNALYNAVIRAALDEDVERFTVRQLEHGVRAGGGVPHHRGLPAALPDAASAYGFSKLTGEVYCRAAHAEHGLRYTICRPFNAYGPGEMPENEPGIAHAVPDLLRKSLAHLKPLPIFGTGEHTRTLTHVDDIADGIVAATAAAAGLNEDFNISAADERTVREIAEICWEAAGNDSGRARVRASAELRGRRRPPLAERREGQATCSAGRRRSASTTASGRRPSGSGASVKARDRARVPDPPSGRAAASC